MLLKKVIFTLGLFCTIQFSYADHQTDSCVFSGLEAMHRKAYTEAINKFTTCLNHSPSNALAYFQRGTCYLLSDKANVALVDFNQTIKLDSSNYEAYFNRGLAHHALKNYTFAEADFLLYHSHVPNDTKVLNNLAILMEDMQDFKAAVEYYSLFLHKFPENKDKHIARAFAFAQIDSIELAIKDLDFCLKSDSKDLEVWMNKGNIYYDAFQYSNAIDAYNVILLNSPEHIEARINRADAFTANTQYKEAIEDFELLSTKDKYNPEYYFNMGFCYLQLNNNQESILSFGKALDTEYPNIGLLLTLRGVAYNNLEMQAEACSDWQMAIHSGYLEAETYHLKHCKQKK